MIRSLHRSALLGMCVALVVLVGACSSSTGSSDEVDVGAPGDERVEPAASPIGRWVSTHVLEDGAPADGFEGVTVNVAIEEGAPADGSVGVTANGDIGEAVIRVHAACNHFGTYIEITDDQLVSNGGIESTAMGCDPVRHTQDEWLTELLLASPAWSLDDGVLTLSADGRALRLADAEDVSVPAPFTSTRWVLDTIVTGEVASSVPAGVEAELTFADDGSFSGFDGCGSLAGTYLLEAGRLRFGAATATAANCEGPSAPVEAAITNAIGRAHDVDIEGAVLTLRSNGGDELVWRAG